MEEGFHRAFVASYTISSSLCCAETWVWRRRENFSMTGISTPSSHSPTPFCFLFHSQYSHSPFFPSPSVSLFRLHNTAPSCLHIAWSKTTNWSFTACSRCAFLSHRSVPSFADVFSPFTHGLHDFSVSAQRKTAARRGNEMTHWKWYCWQVMTVTVTMCHGS